MKTVVLSANSSWYLFNFRASTITTFIDQGYKVVCVSPYDFYSTKLQSELGCDWINLSMDCKGSNPFKDSLLFIKLVLIYAKIKPVVVFNFTIKNNIYGTWPAKLSGARVYNNISGLGTAFLKDDLTTKLVSLLYKVSQPFANHVFCQNPDDFELLVSKQLVEEEKLTLLPGSGVNIDRFHPELKINRQKNHPFRFLFVGRIIADKGIRELITASIKLYEGGCNFVLQFCGSNNVSNNSSIPHDELDSYKQLPFLVWLGETDNVEYALSDCDCVILPSYREGLPRSLLEAGAMGLPCIATNVPGCKHVISHGYNGFLCTAKSTSSLYLQMKMMCNLPDDKYLLMCQNSRENVVENFDEKYVVKVALDYLVKDNCNSPHFKKQQ